MKLMRQLEKDHNRLWDKLSLITPEMKASSDCDPALLSGWTDRNISLWDVSEIYGKPTLEEILIALCHKKKNWEKISYLKFPKEIVSAAGLSLTASNGNTGVQRVDTSNTHFEIKEITGKGLCTLIFHLSNGEYEVGVFTKRKMEEILLEAYDRVSINRVVQGATSQEMFVRSPSSGTEVDTAILEETPKKEIGETSFPDQIPKPSSSTILE